MKGITMATRRGVKIEENNEILKCQVNIRLSEQEADIVVDAAAEAKESMQLWMRTRLVEAARRELGANK